MIYSSFDITKLLNDFNLREDDIESSGFSVKDLEIIYNDYQDRIAELEECKKRFLSDYIISADGIRLHSYSGRVKEPYHLIEKIVRKSHNNYQKYNKMTVDNYYMYITDLIGCRVLIVYKDDWRLVHNYLIGKFKNDPAFYIDGDFASSYPIAMEEPFMAEKPVVYIRAGDNQSLYEGFDNVKISKEGYYRSVHYIIRYGKYYVELQVRSLFEEAWGEVDHNLLYPYYKYDENLVDFSAIINRLSGTGDELSLYFKNHRDELRKKNKEIRNLLMDAPDIFGYHDYSIEREIVDRSADADSDDKTYSSTIGAELEKVFQE